MKTQLRKDNEIKTEKILELEEVTLRFEVKQRFLREMKQRMREKYGFVNLKNTPLQGGSNEIY